MKNIYFFLLFLKKNLFFKNLKFSFKFLKKNYNSIMLLKSPIKYKISKHQLTNHKNKFLLTITSNLKCLPILYDFNVFQQILLM